MPSKTEAQARLMAAADRLLNGVVPEPNSGCWLWLGSGSTSFDYGRLRFGGRVEHAHRLAWMVWRGPIPDDMRVLHKCDVPPCCNPDHLFLGTQTDNVRDMHAKGRDRNQNTDKRMCKHGHEFVTANVYIHPQRGTRHCKACNRKAQERYAERQSSTG